MCRKSDRWHRRIPRDARYNDRKAGRHIDPTRPFINTDALLTLQREQQNLCHYCLTNLNWIERRSCKHGLTLERLNNRLPHYTDNCVLACKSCNSKRFDRETGILKRYFSIWKSITHSVQVQAKDPRSGSFVS